MKMRAALVAVPLWVCAAFAGSLEARQDANCPTCLWKPGTVPNDAFKYANITEVMPGFDIYTYPGDSDGNPDDQTIGVLRDNLRRRFTRRAHGSYQWKWLDGQNYCRLEVGNWKGGNCYTKSTPDPSVSGNYTSMEHGIGENVKDYPNDKCAWTNFKEPTHNATFNDWGLGTYSVRWSATHRWYDINVQGKYSENPEAGYGCDHEGLCMPQFTFYRRGYRLVMSMWRFYMTRKNVPLTIGFPDAKDRYELCHSENFPLDTKDGWHYRYYCVVPCWNDGNIDSLQPFDDADGNVTFHGVFGDGVQHLGHGDSQ